MTGQHLGLQVSPFHWAYNRVVQGAYIRIAYVNDGDGFPGRLCDRTGQHVIIYG